MSSDINSHAQYAVNYSISQWKRIMAEAGLGLANET